MEFFRWICCLYPMGTAAFTGNYSVLQPGNTKWSKMSCDDCNTKFNLLKRKRTCDNCGLHFCTSCLKKGKTVEKTPRCYRCQVLTSVPLNRSSVFDLRVKDLRWFLKAHNVPITGCKEKNDLVDLVMHHASLRNASMAYPQNYERHTIRPEDQEQGSTENSPVFARQSASQAERSLDISSTEHPHDFEIRETEDSGFTLVDIVEEESPRSSREEPVPEDPKESEKSERKEVVEPSFTPLSINDITSVEQISNLTVMQMKLILTRNFVGFKGCCEKQELQDKIRKLWEQKQESKDASEIPDENLCKICMEAPIDSVLLDCGHLVTCTECGKRLHECPICRQYVVRVVHIFKA